MFERYVIERCFSRGDYWLRVTKFELIIGGDYWRGRLLVQSSLGQVDHDGCRIQWKVVE